MTMPFIYVFVSRLLTVIHSGRQPSEQAEPPKRRESDRGGRGHQRLQQHFQFSTTRVVRGK